MVAEASAFLSRSWLGAAPQWTGPSVDSVTAHLGWGSLWQTETSQMELGAVPTPRGYKVGEPERQRRLHSGRRAAASTDTTSLTPDALSTWPLGEILQVLSSEKRQEGGDHRNTGSWKRMGNLVYGMCQERNDLTMHTQAWWHLFVSCGSNADGGRSVKAVRSLALLSYSRPNSRMFPRSLSMMGPQMDGMTGRRNPEAKGLGLSG